MSSTAVSSPNRPTRAVAYIKPAAANGGEARAKKPACADAMHEAAKIIPQALRFGVPVEKKAKKTRKVEAPQPEGQGEIFTGDAWIAARNKLVVENLEWVREITERVARKLPTWFSSEDLVGAAEIALIKLADQYRSYYSVPFRAFARARIGGACYDAIRRREYRERAHSSLSAHGDVEREPEDPGDSPERLAELAEMRGVWKHLDGLPKRHAAIVVLMYGADLSGKDVAERLNLSEGRVSVLHAEALQMLKEMVER